jgi:hypothetical protein
MTGDLQVLKEHYDFGCHVNLPRWNSYWHQIVETTMLNPENVLIIGMGDNIVGEILMRQGITVYTFDFDKTLHPDFVGNITEIDSILQGKHFDAVLCCQVLEHLPYDNFENILRKLKLCADNVIISLPHVCFQLKLALKYIFLLKLRYLLHYVFVFKKQYKFNGEHYWEIGYKGYSKQKIRNSIQKYFMIKKEFLVPHNNYHLFFILK